MTARFILGALARAGGFASGWAFFTLALLVATRPMGLGPGFSRPLPYAIAAIFFSCCGHLIRRWLNEGLLNEGPAVPQDQGLFRYIYRQKLRGLALFFKGTAGFNNFLFLSIAYFIGIGLTSLFIRKPASKKAAPSPALEKPVSAAAAATTEGDDSGAPLSYWRDLHVGKQDADAYYRPF